jgi:hypothetical protein
MANYGTRAEGDTYFRNKLHNQTWFDATPDEREIALTEATMRIDFLRFDGAKVDDDQELEFPRYYGDDPDGTEVVPEAIENATYELAFSLLDGIDPDMELENLNSTSHTYAGIRTNRYAMDTLPHIVAGIPNLTAWRFLMPYLATSRTLKINRA